MIVIRYQRSQMLRDLDTEAVLAGSSQDSVIAEEEVAGARVTESRGRRVSSLGDEVYYALDTDEGTVGVATRLTNINMKHQHSLESYQLYKEKLGKIREKQATMGLEGEAPKLRAAHPSSSVDMIPGEQGTRGPGPVSSPPQTSQTRLNTIQMGLAAIFNPENYIQQQSKKMPFIPGG